MTAHELLISLRRSGIELTVSGNRLRVEAPRGAVTSELRRVLIARKRELLAALSPAVSWPPESLEAERRFGEPHARLYPFLGRTVETPAGPGRLLQVFVDRVAVVLDHDPRRVTYLLPSEVLPPELAGQVGEPFEAVH